MKSLAGQHAHPFVPQFLIRAKHVTDFPRPGSYIPSGHVCILPNMLAQFAHERGAESANLVVRFAFGVKVRPALSAAHGESC